ARLNPEQRKQDEIGARGFFDTTAFAQFNRDKENKAPTNFLGTSSSQFDRYTTGVSQEFTSGASATLTFNNTRSDLTALFPIAFNPSYNASVGVSFTQPLLRNFGRTVSMSGIRIARNGVQGSELEFHRTVMNTLKEVTDAYWDLAAAISGYRVAVQSLDLAKDLLRLNRAKVEVGTLAPIEITQAEAGVASREESVIVAESAIATAEDQLRRLLNVPKGSDLWTRPIHPTDEPPFESVTVDSEAEIATALSRRPDLERQRIELKSLEIQTAADRNGVRPQLDLTGSYGLAGTAGDQRFNKIDTDGDGIPDCDTSDSTCFGSAVDRNGDGIEDVIFEAGTISDAWRQIRDRDLVSWSAGLNFSFPIANRAAKARSARSRIALDQGRLSLQNLERGVEIEVRNAVRQVQTNVKRVQAARVNLDLQRKKLEAEQKRFQYGMTTSFQVLEFQKDLREAESSEIRAILDYNKSLSALANATGTILEKQGIEVR
ncbi:MAG: TolC family protein, partial [Burkholderiales bacterium]